ncbi:four helix bundle protein [Desulfacinum infernum DSM 9756]|uniref:Four helix bundle protein n=1 Tax=Desulfacinum infernum DSM 9756 TaxID=1121391 RepID=A0A1M5GS11_9BACT|nr:four helix bundle protein [Desulfacinum infernum DSM 9756]
MLDTHDVQVSREAQEGRRQEAEVRTHKDLELWKAAMDLAKAVYLVTSRFPREEVYGMTAQMRRAAVSVPCNIAEGAARNSRKEFIQFLYIAWVPWPSWKPNGYLPTIWAWPGTKAWKARSNRCASFI